MIRYDAAESGRATPAPVESAGAWVFRGSKGISPRQPRGYAEGRLVPATEGREPAWVDALETAAEDTGWQGLGGEVRVAGIGPCRAAPCVAQIVERGFAPIKSATDGGAG